MRRPRDGVQPLRTILPLPAIMGDACVAPTRNIVASKGSVGSDGQRYDAIVIGGGQNGLAAAARLAAAGKKVVVLERRDAVGGLCGAIEFHPGYKVPGILHDTGLLSSKTIAALKLE